MPVPKKYMLFSVTHSTLMKQDSPYQDPPGVQKGAQATAHAGQAHRCFAAPLGRRDPQL